MKAKLFALALFAVALMNSGIAEAARLTPHK
jgi:hypothetical protein